MLPHCCNPVVGESRNAMDAVPVSRMAKAEALEIAAINWPEVGDGVNITAPLSALLLSVSMPKVSVPVTPVAPVSDMEGIVMMKPLLSVVNNGIGFCSCPESGCVIPMQLLPPGGGQE